MIPNSPLPPNRIPKFARVAGVDKIVTGRLPRAAAIKEPYVQVNTKDRIFNAIFDLDTNHGMLDWLDNVPILPAYFAGRQKNGIIVRPHAVIKLRIPVNLTKWKQASLYYAIRERIAELLAFGGTEIDGADKITTKNPNSEHWKFRIGDDRLWTLEELRIALDMPAADEVEREEIISNYRQAGDYFNLENAQLGRNCMLFESIRGLVYMYKSQCSSEEQLYQYALEQARQFDALNNQRAPLRPCNVKAAARSTSHWTWHNYTGRGEYRDIRRGACAPDITPDMTLSQRQAVGGRHAVSENARKHQEAVQKGMADNPDFTIKGLAKQLKMSVNTVRKYVRLTQELAAEKQPKPAAEGGVKIVSSGVGAEEKNLTPHIRAERDGEVGEFWIRPEDPDHYYDRLGRRAKRHFIDPLIVWRTSSAPPSVNHAQN